MAEFQTVAAALDLVALTLKVCRFLKKVKDAEGIAKDANDRLERLVEVLDGIQEVVDEDDQNTPKLEDGLLHAVERISGSIKACRVVLQDMENKLRPSTGRAQDAGMTIAGRFAVAFRQGSITRLHGEVDAHISSLHLNLSILHMYNQKALRSQTDSQHRETLESLNRLGSQILVASEVRRCQPNSLASKRQPFEPDLQESTSDSSAEDAKSILSKSIAAAEVVYDRFTSEYNPDARSEREQTAFVLEQDSASPSLSPPLASELEVTSHIIPAPSVMSLTSAADSVDSKEVVPPERILELFIKQHYNHFRVESGRSKFRQAETSLSEAIRYSEMRERVYCKVFVSRAQFHEELAAVYQKQGKWAEAVQRVQQLIREAGEPSDTAEKLVKARQCQLLASIYFDRHRNSPGNPLHAGRDDLESASSHANDAFGIRDQILESNEAPEAEEDEKSRQRDCLQLLFDVFEARGKTVETQVFREMLQEGSSTSSDSLRRISLATTRPPTDYELVEDKQDLLLEAIRTNNSAQMQDFLSSNDFDLEQLSSEQKVMLLLDSIERDDDVAVRKLLSPVNGAEIDGRGRKGITALHLASSRASHKMIECLSEYSPNMNIRDKAGETALLKAVEGNHLTIVKLLADLDADFKLKYEDEWTVLHYAVRQSSSEMTSLVLNIEPRLQDQVDCKGLTALHHCAEQGYLEQARKLLSHRHSAGVDIEDAARRTPLYFAVQSPDTAVRREMVELLVTHSADPKKGRWNPRYEDFATLRNESPKRRVSRHDSISTQGTAGSTSSGISRLSSIFSTRMRIG